jgi:hypothetical protein
MMLCGIYHANTGLQVLGLDPGRHNFRPAPVLPKRLHQLSTTEKSVSTIRHARPHAALTLILKAPAKIEHAQNQGGKKHHIAKTWVFSYLLVQHRTPYSRLGW